MDLASELAPFSPSPELLFWAENRVGGLLEQVKTNATEIHWRDAKIEKLTLELAYLRRMKFGVKSESLAAGNGTSSTKPWLPTWPPAKPAWPKSARRPKWGRINRPPRNRNANAPAVSPCPSNCRVSSTCTSPKPAPVGNVVRRWCGSART
jgi:hypothetical protein